MLRNRYIQYYVEGEDEKKLINVLKTEMGLIRPGKVQKFNVVENFLPNMYLMSLAPKTLVVLVFDTDTGQVDTLNYNIEKLKKCQNVTEIITIPQVANLDAFCATQ